MIDDILYLCDRTRCEYCTYPTCKHTTDIKYSKNYKNSSDIDCARFESHHGYEEGHIFLYEME